MTTSTLLATHPSVARAMRLLLATVMVLTGAICQATTYAGRVVGVTDGDTITVLDAGKTQHKVRLAGIDAPEKAQPFGQRSKQSLSDLVFDKTVTVDTGKTDRYGREVGKVLVSGLDANLEQIKRGLAWYYKAYQSEQPEVDRVNYAEAEKEAAAAHLGLWQDALPVAPWEWRQPAKVAR